MLRGAVTNVAHPASPVSARTCRLGQMWQGTGAPSGVGHEKPGCGQKHQRGKENQRRKRFHRYLLGGVPPSHGCCRCSMKLHIMAQSTLFERTIVLLNLHHLRLFRAIADDGTLSGAAAEPVATGTFHADPHA